MPQNFRRHCADAANSEQRLQPKFTMYDTVNSNAAETKQEDQWNVSEDTIDEVDFINESQRMPVIASKIRPIIIRQARLSSNSCRSIRLYVLYFYLWS